MKLHDAHVAVSAIRNVLIIGENLVHQIAVRSHVGTMPCRVLARPANFVTTQYQADVLVLAHQFGPHRVTVIVRPEPVILRDETVTSRNTSVVKVLVCMSDDYDLSAGIVLDYLRSPREGGVAGVELQRDNQVLLAING